MDALQKISQSCMKNELPSFEVGDTVRVQVKIKEGDKERLQAFEGTVIGIKKDKYQSERCKPFAEPYPYSRQGR